MLWKKTKYEHEAFEIHLQGSPCQSPLPFVTSGEGAVGWDLRSHAALPGEELCTAGFPPVILGCLLSQMSAKSRRIKVVLGLGGRESNAMGSLHTSVWVALHCVFLFLQGGLGLFVQLMPILILIIVSALSQMMVSSPPYSLSQRPLVPVTLKLIQLGRRLVSGGHGGVRGQGSRLSVFPVWGFFFLLYFITPLLLLPDVLHIIEGLLVLK